MRGCVKKEKTTYYQRNKERLLQKQRDDIQKKYENATEGEDFVVCKLCGYKCADLGTHLKSHGINSKAYKEQFGQDTPIKCDKMCRNVSGEKNPAFNHGGKYSPFSENFIYADAETIKATKKKAAQSRVDNNSNSTTIEYWLKKTDGDLDESKKLLSERQSTFSLEKCIEKYGEVDGKKRWLDRQEKWIRTLSKKSLEEIENINRKKSNLMSYSILWKNEANYDGILYVLDIGDGLYKIGITTKTVQSRYKKYKDKYHIIEIFNAKINECFQIEQLIKKAYATSSISKNEEVDGFGWTETFRFKSIDNVSSTIKDLLSNKERLLEKFKTEFNLKYEHKFI